MNIKGHLFKKVTPHSIKIPQGQHYKQIRCGSWIIYWILQLVYTSSIHWFCRPCMRWSAAARNESEQPQTPHLINTTGSVSSFCLHICMRDSGISKRNKSEACWFSFFLAQISNLHGSLYPGYTPHNSIVTKKPLTIVSVHTTSSNTVTAKNQNTLPFEHTHTQTPPH